MHMNNCQYINFALAAIDSEAEAAGTAGKEDDSNSISDLEICSLRADYRLQAHLNDRIYPVVYKNGKNRTVALNNEEGMPYSVVSVGYR
jgi:hypothetical protein